MNSHRASMLPSFVTAFSLVACSSPSSHDASTGADAHDAMEASLDGSIDVLADTTSDLRSDVPASTDHPQSTDAPIVDAPTHDVPAAADVVDVPTDTGTATSCPAGVLGARLGRSRILVGGTMDDTPFAAAPFDIRYNYLAGDVPTPGPCSSCATGCSVNGSSCANSAGCSWWGCWQWDQVPPGQYVRDFVTNTETAHAIPMFSYYIWYSVAGNIEGAPEIAALTDTTRMQRYLADWRFLCQTVGSTGTPPVILHIEPDLWGYAEQVNSDPTMIPAAVSAAGLSECAGLPDTVAGFARCMLQIARADAPNALVGFHASAWGAGADALYTTDPGFDVNAHADTTAAFYRALGATDGDLIVIEMSDRDAGFNMHWFDATNAAPPDFTRALAWQQRLAQDLALPTLYWQIPYGHVGLPNTCNQYEDNRVDYFFSHPSEFANAGLLGIAFGAGANCMTTPTTDNNYFVMRATSFFGTPDNRPCLCGAASCP